MTGGGTSASVVTLIGTGKASATPTVSGSATSGAGAAPAGGATVGAAAGAAAEERAGTGSAEVRKLTRLHLQHQQQQQHRGTDPGVYKFLLGELCISDAEALLETSGL